MQQPKMVQQTPESIVQQPEIDQQQPESIVQKPETVQHKPESIVQKPEMVQQQLELIAQQPALIDPGSGSTDQNGELGAGKRKSRRAEARKSGEKQKIRSPSTNGAKRRSIFN